MEILEAIDNLDDLLHRAKPRPAVAEPIGLLARAVVVEDIRRQRDG